MKRDGYGLGWGGDNEKGINGRKVLIINYDNKGMTDRLIASSSEALLPELQELVRCANKGLGIGEESK